MHKLLFILFGFLFIGCMEQRYLDYEHAIAAAIEDGLDSKALENADLVILIPNSGCSGCIAEAENYYIHCKDDKSKLFVFTNYISERDLRLRLGMSRRNTPKNVIFDSNSKCYLSHYKESIYPIALYLRSGKVIKVTSMDELTCLLEE